MPCVASWPPRTILPPPITSPSPAPSAVTCWISPASRSIVAKSMPKPLSPASASPLILRRTRGYLSDGLGVIAG